MHPANFTHQRELADKFVSGYPGAINLAGGGQNAYGDGQIESPAFFRQVGRCQIDGDSSRWKTEAGVEQCGAYSVFALADRGFRQPDNGESWQSAANVNLD